MRMKAFLSSFFLAIVSIGSVYSAELTRSSTTSFTATKGTADYKDVQVWLEQHNAPSNDNTPAIFTVNYTKAPTHGGVQTDGIPGPPSPLPSSGTDGDVISFSSCSPGGASQSWTFHYDSSNGDGSNGWVLDSYSFHAHTVSCQGL